MILADGRIAYEDGKVYVAEPEPAKIEVAAAGTPPVFSETTLRIMAQNNAKRDHNTTAWGIGGGLLGCGGMYLGAMLGAMGVEGSGGLRYILWAGAGGLAAAEGLANTPDIVVPIPEQLKLPDPQVRNKYRQLYQAETRKLRRKSIYGGMVGCAVTYCGGLFILFSLLYG